MRLLTQKTWIVVIIMFGLMGACAPFDEFNAPTGSSDETICDWLRDAVGSGVMPLELAERNYEQCMPIIPEVSG